MKAKTCLLLVVGIVVILAAIGCSGLKKRSVGIPNELFDLVKFGQERRDFVDLDQDSVIVVSTTFFAPYSAKVCGPDTARLNNDIRFLTSIFKRFPAPVGWEQSIETFNLPEKYHAVFITCVYRYKPR